MNQKISQLTSVSYSPTLVVPAVNLSLPSGSQNVSILASSLHGAALATASTTILGGVKIDGTSITIDGSGVISAVGGGSGSISLSQITDAADLTGVSGQFVGFNSSNTPAAFSKATAQANLSIAKATLTFFMNSVVNGTYTLLQRLPAGFTIDSVDTSVQFGSFIISSINLNSTSVTALTSLTVNSATNVNTTATSANVGSAGNTITMIISGANQAIGGVVSLNLTRN